MENLTSVKHIFPRQLVEEQEKVILDEVSKTLGEIKTDINYLKKGQEDLTAKVDEIKEKQIQNDAQQGIFKNVGAGIWAVILLVIAAYIGFLIH